MKIVKSVIWFVLLLLLGIKVGSIEVFAQGINMEKWMSQLSDEKHLSEFSLPGTHESAATKGIKIPIWGKDYGKCQNESLINQLSMGVRYFDIRCRYLSETTLAIHHGDIYQNLMFGDVLNTFNNFLNTHPTETIVMRFKQEKSSVSDEEFRKALAYYVAKYPSNLFWENKDHTRRTPILKELRGKIILLYDISIANNSWDEFGLTYGSFSSQDYYATSDRDKKWQNIKQCLERANKDITLGVINYSSAQGDWKCTPEDLSRTLNPKLCSELRDSKYIHSGIIASDFMNQELSSLIISLNWRQMVYSLFEDEAQTKINKNIYYGRINEVRNTITSLSESEEKNRLLGMVENAKKLYEEQQQVEIVVGNSEIQVGDTWQASDNFVSATAKDGTQTTDINDVKVSGTVDTTKAGVYPITYEYDGATKTINVTVKEKAPEAEAVIEANNSEITVGDTWQASDNFVSATAKDGTQTTDINDVKVSGTVDTTKAGVYPITYEYDGATKTINVTVKEKAPEAKAVIEANDSEITVGDTWQASDNFVSATAKDGTQTTDINDIKVSGTVDTTKAGVYPITYEYDGATKTINVTVKEKAPEAKAVIEANNSEITVGDTWQASDNFVSATAKDGTKTTDINDIKVSGTVDTTKVGVYPITYEYDGATKTINVTVKEKAPETDVEKVDLTSVYRLRNSKSYERLYTIDENEKNNLTVKHANLGWYEEKSPNSSLNLKVLKTKPENGKQFYRLKNVKSGEHLFTADENEVKVLTTKYGWTIERNINMYVYGESGKPKDAKRIYRLRNTKSGERVYTVDENEKKVLTTRYAHLGWIEEGQAISSRMYTK